MWIVDCWLQRSDDTIVGLSAASWSPDGKWLETSQCEIADRDGNVVQTGVCGQVWSPDSARVASFGTDVRMVTVPTGEARRPLAGRRRRQRALV